MSTTAKLMSIILVGIMPCVSQVSAAESQDAKTKFSQSAENLGGVHPWDVPELSVSQQQSVLQLKAASTQLMQQHDYAAAVTALLDQYKEQDGYARQALLRAIIQKRDYTAADLLFLKSVFNATIHFHYDEYPRRVRVWLTPIDLRSQLADLILIAAGRGDAAGTSDGDYKLLFKDPSAWLAKYAP